MINDTPRSIIINGMYEGNIGLIKCCVKVVNIKDDSVTYCVNNSNIYNEMNITKFNQTFLLINNY
jgi:hypothetical protein